MCPAGRPRTGAGKGTATSLEETPSCWSVLAPNAYRRPDSAWRGRVRGEKVGYLRGRESGLLKG